jgi:ribosome-binding factor A
VSGVKRSVRVGHAMREELARAVLFDVKDPRVRGVVVTSVRVTDDLREATVFFVVEGGADDARLRDIARGLKSVSGFLRKAVTAALRLRSAPELTFEFDESIERGARIERLLSEIKQTEGGG